MQLGLPELAGHSASYQQRLYLDASIASSTCNIPALGISLEFVIDPFPGFETGADQPDLLWQLPTGRPNAEVFAELKQADERLINWGACGPDDRGAYFRCTLCVVWPDMESVLIEECVAGQLGALDRLDLTPEDDVFASHFLPDGVDGLGQNSMRDTRTWSLAALPQGEQQKYSALGQALNRLFQARST